MSDKEDGIGENGEAEKSEPQAHKGPSLVSTDGEGHTSERSRAEREMANPRKEIGANDDAIRLRIKELETEHGDLDLAISTLEERMPYDRLAIQRLKKKKLLLKDEIAKLQDELLPDIIA